MEDGERQMSGMREAEDAQVLNSTNEMKRERDVRKRSIFAGSDDEMILELNEIP